MSQATYELLYASHLAPGVGPVEIDRILQVSRINNRNDDITGLLAFDGTHFCQYVEGPRDRVVALAERLQRDPRHTRYAVLHQGDLHGARRFNYWRLAYAYAHAPRTLASVMALSGVAAVERLMTSLPELDIGVE